MPKIKFHTNLDAYKAVDCFPKTFSLPPRIGEKVYVKSDYNNYFVDKKLPVRLEVVDVSWVEIDTVICELHFSKIDAEFQRLR